MRRTCLPRLHRRQRKHANSIHKHDIFSLYTFFYIYILYTSCIYIFSILIAPACHDSTADIRVARSPHIKFIYSLHILSFICISYTHRTCMPRLHGRQLSCAISVHKYGRFSSYISILMHTTYTSHLHAKTLLQTAEVLNLHMYISNMIFIDFRWYAYNIHIAPARQGPHYRYSGGALLTQIFDIIFIHFHSCVHVLYALHLPAETPLQIAEVLELYTDTAV